MQIDKCKGLDQPMMEQFSKIAQRYISQSFICQAYIDSAQHSVTNSVNKRTRKQTGSTARKKKRIKDAWWKGREEK